MRTVEFALTYGAGMCGMFAVVRGHKYLPYSIAIGTSIVMGVWEHYF